MGSTPRTDFWKVYASADGVTYKFVENISVPDHSYRRFVFRVEDVLPGATNLSLRFVADDAGDGSIVEAAVDDVELLELDNSVGVPNLASLNLIVYPNPAREILTISFPSQSGTSDLRIINAVGQQVYAEQLSASQASVKTISVRDFPAGIYQVVLKSDDGISNVTVVVQH
jgi:hypothetical protein